MTGGVCKEQGRIHRAIVTRDYYAFQLHENELQSQSELRLSLEDYLRLSASEPIVSAIVARVLPRGFGAYGPTVVHSFLLFIIGGPLSVPGIQKRIRW